MSVTVVDPKQQKEDRRRTRMGALAVTLTKTDRILSGRDDVTFAFVEDAPYGMDGIPAWNDGKRISVNQKTLPSIESASGLVTCLGLNYHELSHVLFTLGNSTPFVNVIRMEGEWKTYNLLEDMRIEALFSAQYISAKKYLTAPVLEFIVNDSSIWPTAHLLTYGRRYLPLEIRKEFRKRFTGTEFQRKGAERIIDEYRMLDLSDESLHDTARRLVHEMHMLLQGIIPSLDQQEQNALDAHKGCGGVDNFTNDKRKVAKAERDAGRRRDDETAVQDEKETNGDDGSDFYDDNDDDSSDDGMADDDSADVGDAGEGDAGDVGGDGDEEGDDGSDGQDGGSDSGTPVGAASGGSADGDSDGAGSGQGGDVHGDGSDDLTEGGSTPGASTIENLVQKAIEAIGSDGTVREEITRLQDAMDNSANVDALKTQAKFSEQAPSPAAGSACGLTIREFQQLNVKFEAGWEYGSDHGRVNVQRAMTASFGDTDIYDSWDEGRELDAGLEAVILLDDSVSMRNVMASASEAAWIVKRGMDDVDGLSTVITFGSETRKLYGRGEKANPGGVRHVRELGSSTLPAEGMEEARRILSQSDRPNRLFVIVTDGGFMWGHDYATLLNSIPGTRIYIGIEQDCEPSLEPCYDAHMNVSHPTEIVAVVRQAVRSMLDEAYKRR